MRIACRREPIARHHHHRDAPELSTAMALLRSIVQRCRVASTAAARLNGCPAAVSMASFEGERTSHAIRGFMSQSGSSTSVDGLKSVLWQATTTNSTHSLGFSGLVCQQVRSVMVEVTNDDLERAIRKMKRRLKDDNGIKLLRERQYHRKPSELKVLARKERDKRIAKKAFRAKLKWITARQARGF